MAGKKKNKPKPVVHGAELLSITIKCPVLKRKVAIPLADFYISYSIWDDHEISMNCRCGNEHEIDLNRAQ
jgi:hypothetical protein